MAAGVMKGSDDPSSTAERILSVALDHFATFGFEGASVRKICREAGVNVAALNYHWGSKEKLWDEAYRRLSDRLLAATRDALSPTVPLRDALVAYTKRLLDHLAEDDRVLRLGLWSATGNRTPITTSLLALRPLFEFLRGHLREGVRPGVDVELSLFAVHAMVSHVFLLSRAHGELLGESLDDPAYRQRIGTYLVDAAVRLLRLDGAEDEVAQRDQPKPR